MVPLRPAKLFRSRWAALLWAGGILWFALDVAGTKPVPADGNSTAIATTATDNGADLQSLENEVHAFEALN